MERRSFSVTYPSHTRMTHSGIHKLAYLHSLAQTSLM